MIGAKLVWLVKESQIIIMEEDVLCLSAAKKKFNTDDNFTTSINIKIRHTHNGIGISDLTFGSC